MNPIELGKDIKAQKDALLTDLREGRIERPDLTRALNDMTDNSVQGLASHFLGDYADKVALVFTGANGRMELSPHSDLDVFLLVDPSLFDGKKIPDDQEAFSGLSMAMMDAKLGIRSLVLRTPDHCVEDVIADQETWTQLIDRRFGWGSRSLYEDMAEKLGHIDQDKRKAFIVAKFEEYDKRLAHFDDVEHSRFEGGKTSGGRYAVIEPNVKTGYGALRGFQTAQWVSKTQCGIEGCDIEGRGLIDAEDVTAAQEAYEFIFDIRAHLHDISGREDDILYSSAQPEITKRLGYQDVTRFMRDYFQATRAISYYAKMVCSDVADQLDIRAPGTISDKVLDFDGALKNPIQIMEIYKRRVELSESLSHHAVYAVRHGVDMMDEDFVQSPEANALMLDILAHPNAADTLMQMNKHGVLTRMIPELAPIRDLIQFDPYHAYTVDQHTINGIGNLHDIIAQKHADLSPAASDIAQGLSVDDRKVLAVALLLHDVHKGSDASDMKAFNKELVEHVGARLGLQGEHLDRASWLAQNHLLLKHTSRYEDIDDPQSIERFAEKIPDLKHLELLRVMTISDTLALGPGRLSPHAAFRADTIYERARQSISGLTGQYNRQALQLPADYEDGKPYIRLAPNKNAGVDVLTVITPDKPYLLENLTAALDRSSTQVLNARISTIENGHARAVNRFIVQNSVGSMHTERQSAALIKILTDAVTQEDRMKIAPVAAFNDPSRNPQNHVFEVQPHVEFSNALSDHETSMRVTARARPHLLHALTSVINDMDLNLTYASITARGHQAVDVFKIQTRDGFQISRSVQNAVRKAVMEQIEEDTSLRPDAP